MENRGARHGGLPLRKLIGNRILARAENAVLGVRFTESHFRYRAYSTRRAPGVRYRGYSQADGVFARPVERRVPIQRLGYLAGWYGRVGHAGSAQSGLEQRPC